MTTLQPRPALLTTLAAGAVAGAAGTTALNAATYVDMGVRGRPASTTPERTVATISRSAGLDVPGDEDTRGNRLTGLGALIGIATGVGLGTVVMPVFARLRLPLVAEAAVLGAAAMASTDVSMAVLGVTDPRTWGAADWAADLVPHLAYGLVTAAGFHLATRG